jgi:altronate dehydratase small subunit
VPPPVALKLTARDNVATLVAAVEPGGTIAVRHGREQTSVAAGERIPFGFKVALADIPRGAQVVKYGESIGLASADIPTGALVHVHNLEGARGRGDLARGDTA